MQKNLHELEKIIAKNFGKRCKDYNPFCACCIMWHAYNTIKEGTDFGEPKFPGQRKGRKGTYQKK